VGVFSIAFAPTVFVLWMNTIQDAALGWLVSTLTGGAIGAFLVQVLLQPRGDGPAPKRPTLVCFGIGIGFGILRLSRAEGIEDYLVAVGLTVLECAVVAGLDWFAEKHFQSVATYRVAQAQRIALEQALDELKANLAIERSRYGGLQEQLRARESESFDVEPLAEQAAWAVEAAYRAAVHANQRCLEGGGSFALPAA
jgi:hypothetical protein